MVKAKDALDSGGATPDYETRASSSTSEAGPNQIRADIAQTRAQMDRTLNALGDLLSPRNLLNEFFDLFRSVDAKAEARRLAANAGRRTLESIKEHPVPSALAGAGLIYMLLVEGSERDLLRKGKERIRAMSSRSREKTDVFATPACEPSVVEYVGGETPAGTTAGMETSSGQTTSQKAKEKLSGMAETVRDKAASAADTAKGAASSTAEGLRSKASDLSEAAKGAAATATETLRSTTSSTAARAKNITATAAQNVRSMASETAHRVRDAASSTSTRVGELASRAGNTARQVSHNVRTGAVEAGHIVRAKAADIGNQVRQGYSYTRDKAAQVSDEHPLGLGGALLGLGLLVGLTLPRTRREDELMGDKADQFRSRARTKGKEAVNRGMQIAQTTAEQTIDEAKRQGLTASSLIDRAKHVAADLKNAATDIAQREEMTAEQLSGKVKAVADHAKETARQELNMQETNV